MFINKKNQNIPKENVSVTDNNISSTNKDVSATDDNDFTTSSNIDEENIAGELTSGDIEVASAKKTITIGEILNISLYPSGTI